MPRQTLREPPYRLRGRPLPARERPRKPDHHLDRVPFRHEFGDPLHVATPVGDGLDRSGQHATWIARGDADADLSDVHTEPDPRA